MVHNFGFIRVKAIQQRQSDSSLKLFFEIHDTKSIIGKIGINIFLK